MKLINTRLRAARVLQGFSQAELAEKISRSQTWVCQLERGLVEPSDLDVSIICRVLQVDPNYLFPKPNTAELESLEGSIYERKSNNVTSS